MAHFAKLNDENIVIEINVVNNEILDPENEETSGIEFLTHWSGGYSNWVQCSYNSNFRKSYPAIGDRYDSDLDAFISPQPYPSWTLNDQAYWTAPIAHPNDGKLYNWDEDLGEWHEAYTI